MQNEYLTIPELAEITRESQAVWRKRIQRREIRFLKAGSNVRVDRKDFKQWVNDRLTEKGAR